MTLLIIFGNEMDCTCGFLFCTICNVIMINYDIDDFHATIPCTFGCFSSGNFEPQR